MAVVWEPHRAGEEAEEGGPDPSAPVLAEPVWDEETVIPSRWDNRRVLAGPSSTHRDSEEPDEKHRLWR